MSRSMSIVVAADKNYLPHMAVTVHSALCQNPKLFSRVFLLSADVSEGDLQELNESLEKAFSIKVELLPIEGNLVDDLYVSGHVAVATYLRFIVADVLPPEVSVALYLDCDTVTVGDLSELSRIQSTFDTTAAPRPWLGAAVRESTGNHLRQFGFKSSEYFNAGVILINVAQWRQERLSELLFSTARKFHGLLPWWDQDVLNLVMESRWLPLDSLFNATWAGPQDVVRIAHFSGKEKPWNYGCSHPLRYLYDESRRLTPFWPYRKSGLFHYAKKAITPGWWSPLRKALKRHQRKVLKRFQTR